MIFWTVEGARISGPNDLGHLETTWFGSAKDAKDYIEAHRWEGEPELAERHWPRSRAERVEFLNHFAGS